ncbi:bifunctional metallophosphatase/5'-nucleotidase [Streptococcus gallolyticus]|nr:bifunctional metallophosphatase/5'-nucleotidase [Streptococcus gallolyticus]MBY5040487.1 bifunctional metallophosphatase/5'-nucleotidase [Streptococcus gallolyticus]
MKKNYRLKSALALSLLSLGLLGSVAAADQVNVQILGVNDFHGALTSTGSAYMENGQKVSGAGTAALLSSYLNQAENDFLNNNAGGVSIRVQAGDMVGASPANSGLLQDEPTVKIFNAMKFQYGTLGNHEFDEGLDEFHRIMTGQAPTPGQFASVVDSYPHEASQQSIVIANVVDGNGNVPFADWKPYDIKEIQVGETTEKIGFIGVVTGEIPNLVLKKHYENYTFLNEAETIVKYAKVLRDQGVKAIVVLAHIPATSSADQAQGEMATIMQNVQAKDPENSVDIVFAGHNHMYTNGTVGTTRIVQATSQGKAFANVTGTIDTTTHDFTTVPTAEVKAVDPNGGLAPDASIQTIAADADARIKPVTEARIGTATPAETITREVDKDKESPVGKVITIAQLEMARQAGYAADFAMTNNGGIRADLDVQADGTITWGAAQKVQPFGNILQIIDMTGQDIIDVLNQQYDEEEKYFLQISGLKYIYTNNEDPAQPYKIAKAYKADGTELDPAATYKVVINDFLFGGGDGFSGFTGKHLAGAISSDTETFVNYIKDLDSKGQAVTVPADKVKTYMTAEELSKLEQGTTTTTTSSSSTVQTSTSQTQPTTPSETPEPSTTPEAKKVGKTQKILPRTGQEIINFLPLAGLGILVGLIRFKSKAKKS